MTAYIIPAIMALILACALRKKAPVYSVFIDGAEEGMKTVLGIFPCMLAILTAVAMLRASGALELFIGLLAPVTRALHIPDAVMPLALIRPVSGSGALGLLTDILNTQTPDSMAGRVASVMMGSTETTFYTLMVYFQRTQVKYTKRAVPAAVFGDIVGILASVFVCKIFF